METKLAKFSLCKQHGQFVNHTITFFIIYVNYVSVANMPVASTFIMI